ncbi:hypothetical protein K504DRAFT_460808 [Pleomassaria siparia CBS 279.74]|uniref:Cyanovirin-N domain-containing protein n=1 Tax=Pleomassaria siparia CBS 279.74 TaxID=1314801 RepID=A0A6G1JXM7_9PLEO|nr:hypothetical protein K504DRAFT_460808 [Pleomassaria siparia CBS 279.74]
MHFTASTLLLPLTLLASTGAAAPTSTLLQKRGLPGAVYVCTDQNFQGDCAWQAPNTDCRIVGTGFNAPESVGPDPGGYCVLYKAQNCNQSLMTIRFPGLGTGLPTGFPNGVGSMRCAQDGQVLKQGNPVVESSTMQASKLAGGVGSTERKHVEGEIKDMQKDGFKDGFIGQKKKMYY